MKLVVIPHRRGRHELYQEMNLEVMQTNSICFEQWYLRSFFENCIVIGYGSSIWGVLEDNRTNNILIDLGLHTPYWILNRIKISQIIEL